MRRRIKAFKDALILFVGVGGLGCSSLKRAVELGAHRIRLVDGDTVEESNLERQVLFSPEDVGSYKSNIAGEWARRQEIQTDFRPYRLDRTNLFELINDVDIIIDGTDNAASRELLNRAYTTLGKPVVFGAATEQAGHCLVCAEGRACYRCVWKDAPSDQTCESLGVSVELVHRIGTFQADLAAQILNGGFTEASPNLYTFNDATKVDRQLFIDRFERCPICASQL